MTKKRMAKKRTKKRMAKADDEETHGKETHDVIKNNIGSKLGEKKLRQQI